MSADLVSYDDEYYNYSDELDEEFQRLRLTQQRINTIAQQAHRATSNTYGVASFECDDEEEGTSSKEVDWETLGACYDYVGINREGSDLDKLLKSVPHHKNAHFMGHHDNETLSTCSTSDGTVNTTSTPGTVFVSSSVGQSFKKSGSKSVKTKLRAIASAIDPKLSQKIKGRRGFWNGTFEEHIGESGVEVVIVP